MNHLDYAQAKCAEARDLIVKLGPNQEDEAHQTATEALDALEAAVRYIVVEVRELRRLAEEEKRPLPPPAGEQARRPSDEWARGDPDAWRPWPVVVRDIDAKLDRLLALERHVEALGDSYHAMIGLLERLGPRG